MAQVQYIKTGSAFVQAALDKYWGGGAILWVGNRTGTPSGDGTSPDYPLASLFGTGGALAKLQGKTNTGAVIFVLAGHAESISSADHASATSTASGFAIVGLGSGRSRPTFTWTAATATWLLDTESVFIDNCQLLLAGADAAGTALTVAAPITVSAAGCGIRNCRVRFGFDADQIVTTGITFTASADNFVFEDNHCSAETAAECTTFMQIIGVDGLVMRRNYIAGATSSTSVGIIRFATTASLNIVSQDNTFINRKALSTCAVTGLAGVSGASRDDHFAYLDTSSLTPWLTSTGIMTFHRPTVTNTAGETGTEVVGVVSA